jgi:competence protein ComEC
MARGVVAAGNWAGAAGTAPPPHGPAGVVAAFLSAIETERPHFFVWLTVFLGGGIGLYFALPAEPALAGALALPAAAAVVWAAMRRGSTQAALALALVAMATGFAIAKVRTELVRAPVLERRMALAEVKGFVELVEPKPQRGGRVMLRVVSIAGLAPEATPKRVRVRVMGSIAGLRPGDGVRLRATLSAPAAPALPGAYDFARNAWFLGLGGVGYALARPEPEPSLGAPPATLRFFAEVEKLRAAIGRRITAGIAGETGAIANALITGERGAITQATNDAYRDSGLFHALSISGLHMAVMAGAIFWSLRLVLACIPALALRYPIKKWAAAGAAAGALFYLMISGSSPATVRSCIMISIMFLAIMMDRQALALRNIALSALLILLLTPDSLTDLGFQMSYTAVAAIVAAHEYVERLRARRRVPGGLLDPHSAIGRGIGFFLGIALSTVIASLAVAPFGAYYFHTSQQYAILGNVLGLPICDLFIMPLALAVLVAMPFGLEQGPLWLMGLGIDLLTSVARFVAAIPGAVASVPAMPDAAFVAIVLGGIWLALWGSRWRLLGLVPIIAGVALAPFGARPDVLVGQDGQAVAARIMAKGLSALPVKGRSFELTRWLEHDGDARSVREVASGGGFACDAVGCTARVKGLMLAVARRPAAFEEDCAQADIVVLAAPRPSGCTRPRVVLDNYALKDRGTHALYLDGKGGVTVASVADARGDRPWSGSGLGKPPSWLMGKLVDRGRAEAAAAAQQRRGAGLEPGAPSRLEAFAAPKALIEASPEASAAGAPAPEDEELDPSAIEAEDGPRR